MAGIGKILGWPKVCSGFSVASYRKTQNEPFGQPNAKVNKSLPYMANTISNIETHVKKKITIQWRK